MLSEQLRGTFPIKSELYIRSDVKKTQFSREFTPLKITLFIITFVTTYTQKPYIIHSCCNHSVVLSLDCKSKSESIESVKA
ncbi:hypothetical protein F511_28718 [Dorcoceras hygrometricum]|uniref:Uncharacterized protein n=1 Tax=Dorcoceras hygrometricum TaxID=472368 RepID=A0A2Z7CQB5_9LAMI|nr:hypothetical protein F511_28718 [Dorcoceras hygrometricum]